MPNKPPMDLEDYWEELKEFFDAAPFWGKALIVLVVVDLVTNLGRLLG